MIQLFQISWISESKTLAIEVYELVHNMNEPESYKKACVEYVVTFLYATKSGENTYPLTFIVPLSFFIISKKNRKIVTDDIKSIFNKISCKVHNIATKEQIQSGPNTNGRWAIKR